MYVAKPDMEILRSLYKIEMQYYEKFGEYFPYFNYIDFLGTETKRPAQVYKEALEKALLDDKPYHIVSHRYDVADH